MPRCRVGSPTGPPGFGELDDGPFGRLEQSERGAHHRRLAVGVTGSAERATHRMLGDQGTSDAHQLRDVPERSDVHPDRRDACQFECSLDVSDRHVAHGSNGHEEHGVDVFGDQLLRPRGADVVLDPSLGSGTDEGVGDWCELADHAVALHRLQVAER